MSSAEDYNRRQLDAGALSVELVTELVRHWQLDHNLEHDGMAGPRTLASIEAERLSRLGPPPFPASRCLPLRALRDGRRPTVTSRFKSRNPDRPTHNGCDLFYRYDAAKDPPMRAGDGGRTSSGWWIPDATHAIAVAAATVELAGASKTGFRVWLDLGGGWHVGYFHLSSIDVKVGDVVELGTPIGIVGDNPSDTDARHLHFELYFGELGQYPRGCRDPEALLEGATLLPAA